jgi:AraC-like DNA-binding protein
MHRPRKAIMDDSTSPAHLVGGDRDVSMHRITMARPQRGTVGPRPDHVLFWLDDGSATVTTEAGDRVDLGPRHPMLLSADHAYAFTTTATRTTLVHLSRALIERVAPSIPGSPAQPRDFLPIDRADPRIGPLLALLTTAAGPVFDAHLAPDARASLNERIGSVALATFTRTRSDVKRRLRMAVRFVDGNADRAIDVADIAAATGLTERGLQDLFRRNLAVSPMHYLREVRLDRTHLDLLALSRTGRDPQAPSPTIRAIARRWGFSHFGRFSAHYRDRFGETPSETLQRSAGERTRG